MRSKMKLINNVPVHEVTAKLTELSAKHEPIFKYISTSRYGYTIDRKFGDLQTFLSDLAIFATYTLTEDSWGTDVNIVSINLGE